MSTQHQLYQSLILDHSRRPRYFEIDLAPTHEQSCVNPLCGDRIRAYCYVNQDDCIEKMGFDGQGCAISVASTSMMAEQIQGMKLADFSHLMHVFTQTIRGVIEPDESVLGKLVVLAGVSAYPMRVKCATCGWHALAAALAEQPSSATEGKEDET